MKRFRKHKLFKLVIRIYFMEQGIIRKLPFGMNEGFITITTGEYVRLKKKEKIADDAIVQLGLSLDDMRKGRVSKF